MIFYCIVCPDANKRNDVSEQLLFWPKSIYVFMSVNMQFKFTFRAKISVTRPICSHKFDEHVLKPSPLPVSKVPCLWQG